MLQLTAVLNFSLCNLSCILRNQLASENPCVQQRELQRTALLCLLAAPAHRGRAWRVLSVCAQSFGRSPGRHRAFPWAWDCRRQGR